ncbi:MAG: TetR family transcriptional regulator [Gammaproteobacteria bacterium]|nr:TetR family transcriptional regulator [Gammaproteobacteria bacterium]
MPKSKKKIAYRRKSAEQRRLELMRAGLKCLGKGGMSGFTIDQICKQAGVSRGLINHHFKTKDELLICIYADMTEHLVQNVHSDDPHQKLVEIVETSFDEHSFNRSNLRAWLSIWGEVANNNTLNHLHQSRYHRYKEGIAEVLREIAATDKPGMVTDSVARQLIALIDGLWLEHCLHSESFSLATAKKDCYRFLQSHGVNL